MRGGGGKSGTTTTVNGLKYGLGLPDPSGSKIRGETLLLYLFQIPDAS